MKNTTDLVIKAINYQYPEEIPVYFSFLPSAMKKNGDAIKKIVARHPALLDSRWLQYDYDKSLPGSYRYGSFTDAWGCVWSNEQEGGKTTGIRQRQAFRNYTNSIFYSFPGFLYPALNLHNLLDSRQYIF